MPYSEQELLDFTERDVCTKLITPAILKAGWKQKQFREEVMTQGRVKVGEACRARNQ